MSTKYIKKIEGSGYVSTAVEPVYGKGHSRTSAVNPDVYVDGVWMDSVNGTEKVVNGTFDTDTAGWTASDGTISISLGRLKVISGGAGYGRAAYVVTTVIGTKYTVMYDALQGTITARFQIGTTLHGSDYYLNSGITTVNDISVTFVAETTSTYLEGVSAAATGDSYYDNISVFETAIEPNAILPAQTYLPLELEVDASGNPVEITDTKKVEVVAEKIVAEEIETSGNVVAKGEFQGKNACTAWVNFDGTTTPPTIRDSFNVSDVVRTGTGSFVVYFIIPMSNANYQNAFTASRSDDYTIRYFANDLSVSSIEVFTKNTGDVASNYPYNNLITFGGKA